MISILFFWTTLFFLFTGIGLLLRRVFGTPVTSISDLLLDFWIGWAATIAALQIWHFGQPVNGLCLVILFGISFISLLINVPQLLSLIRSNIHWSLASYSLLIAVIVIWFFSWTRQSIGTYDAGLYHLQLVKWIKSYPLVPGLGNLHSRFAYNSSFYLYAALLDNLPRSPLTYRLANSLLLLILLFQSIVSTKVILSQQAYSRSFHLFHTLMLAPILLWVNSKFFVSISADLSIFALGIILVGQLFKFWHRPESPKEDRNNLLVITFLACVGIVVKLSFAAMGVTAVVLALVMFVIRNRSQSSRFAIRSLILSAVVGLTVLVPWMMRGVWLSGYPLYPISIVSAPVEWRVPRVNAVTESIVIRSWARSPRVPWEEVWNNWGWLKDWIKRLPREVYQALNITFIGSLMAFLLGRKAIKSDWLGIILIVPVASIIYWFFSAPDVRFVGSAFWVLAVGSLVVAAHKLKISSSELGNYQFSALLLVLLFLYVSPLSEPIMAVNQSSTSEAVAAIPKAVTKAVDVEHGSVVYVPIEGQQCWNAPLPCTPAVQPFLQFRDPENLAAGFKANKDLVYTPIPGFTFPYGFEVRLLEGFKFREDRKQQVVVSPAKFLVYAGKKAKIFLHFVPTKILLGSNLLNEVDMKVAVNNSSFPITEVVRGVEVQLPINIRSGYNSLTFTLNLKDRQLNMNASDGNGREKLMLFLKDLSIDEVDKVGK
jgi:hypothetical protein